MIGKFIKRRAVAAAAKASAQEQALAAAIKIGETADRQLTLATERQQLADRRLSDAIDAANQAKESEHQADQEARKAHREIKSARRAAASARRTADRWVSPAPFVVLATAGVVALGLVLVAVYAIATTNAANTAEAARLEKAAAELQLQLAADAAIEHELRIDAICERAQSESRAVDDESEKLSQGSEQLLAACQTERSPVRLGRIETALALIESERKNKQAEEERQAQEAADREANLSCGEADAMRQSWEYLRTTHFGFEVPKAEREMVDRVLGRCRAESEAKATADVELARVEFYERVAADRRAREAEEARARALQEAKAYVPRTARPAPTSQPSPARPTAVAPARAPTTRAPTPSGDIEDCFSAWDGNLDPLEDLVRPMLQDEGSMETHETRFSGQPGPDGWHQVRMTFSAENAFGGRVKSIAVGRVRLPTNVEPNSLNCSVALDGIVDA